MPRLSFLVLLLLLAVSSWAQSNERQAPPNDSPVLSEVVIGIPNLDNEQIPAVKSALQSLSGVSWAGYCADQHLVLLKVDRSIQSDNKKITDQLISYKIYFKDGAISEALNVCADRDKALLR